MQQQRNRQPRVYTNDTGLQSVCGMDSSDEDVVVLTMTVSNNCGAIPSLVPGMGHILPVFGFLKSYCYLAYLLAYLFYSLH